MKHFIAIAVTVAALTFCSQTKSNKVRSLDFPLANGTYWVYEGTVKWAAGREVRQKDLTWKMDVIDTVDRGDVVGYALRGHPSDLAWYDEGKPPSEYAIVQFGQNKFYRTDIKVLERLKDPYDSLDQLVYEGQLILDFPLVPGKRFCEPEYINRTDGNYCWLVGQDAQVISWHVDGILASETISEHALYFVTVPDHTIIHFAPSIGITRYEYVHHGTVSEAIVKLIEYHPGTR